MTNFSDQLDHLASVTSELLGSESITVHRRRVTGAYDPSTRTRAIEVDPKVETVTAIASPQYRTRDERAGGGGNTITNTFWEVLASDLTFRPTAAAKVVDSQGREWKVSRVEDLLEGRKYKIHCVRGG